MYPGWGWANILVDSVRPSPTISSCHHQNSCLLHISACNGLTKLTRLTPQQQQSAMWRFRNIFTSRNIEIQIYSSHSIHVLVLNGSTDIVKDISEIGIKLDYNINVLKELLLLGALTDMWSWNGHSVELAGWWREFHLTNWVWCVWCPSWLTPSDLLLFGTIQTFNNNLIWSLF